MRGVLSVLLRSSLEMFAFANRTIFAQPDPAHVSEQFDVIAGMLGKYISKVETMMHKGQR